MPRTRECDFCGADIEPGTGTMLVLNDGSTHHFCSAKCEKNVDLGREARDLEWTEAGQRQSGGQTQAEPEPVEEIEADEATEAEDEEPMEADTEDEEAEESTEVDESDADDESADGASDETEEASEAETDADSETETDAEEDET